MLKLHEIVITNFKSYEGTTKFKFPEEAGLYFFGGQNLVNKLGPNGSGKSTFLDAIVWCLYGRTTRGLKANDILPWGKPKTCTVSLTLTIGEGNCFLVKRTQHPNSLLLGDKLVDQEELEKHLRLNFTSFMYSVMKAQFSESFFSLTPANKLTLFSDIMNLDFWLRKSDEARRAADELQISIDAIADALKRRKFQKEALEETIDQFKGWSREFAKTKANKVANLKLRIQKAKDDYRDVDVTEAIRAVEAKLSQCDRQIDAQLHNINKDVKEKALRQGQLKELASLPADSICPTCHQRVKETLTHQRRIKIEQLKEEIIGYDEDIEMSKKFLVKTKSSIGTLNAQLDSYHREESKKKELKAQIKRLRDELQTEQTSDNPYKEGIDSKQAKVDTIVKIMNLEKANLSRTVAAHAAYSYWPKGFKKLRLSIIEQTFRTLEVEVNNSLAQLGLPDWEITFDVERENKSGGFTKGFLVFVKSPKNKKPVRWESWSGGETQRLQLAGDLGLSNLIMTQAGLSNTIEFFDEPSTHLSQEGMLDLANLLQERALTEDKTIWIVDHTTITNFGDFKGTITVRKDENGSAISYERS